MIKKPHAHLTVVLKEVDHDKEDEKDALVEKKRVSRTAAAARRSERSIAEHTAFAGQATKGLGDMNDLIVNLPANFSGFWSQGSVSTEGYVVRRQA